METIDVNISAERFDTVLEDGLSESGDLELAVKPDATKGGNPAVCITFTVATGVGFKRAQAVTTLRALKAAVNSIPDNLEPGAQKNGR